MTYQSQKRKEIFDKVMVKKNGNNYRLIAVIYLFTVDSTLWKYKTNNEKGCFRTGDGYLKSHNDIKKVEFVNGKGI